MTDEQRVVEGAPKLSRAEQAVINALWHLGSSSAAAEHLGVSVKTVRTHLRNIRRRVGADSTVKLVCMLKNPFFGQASRLTVAVYLEGDRNQAKLLKTW